MTYIYNTLRLLLICLLASGLCMAQTAQRVRFTAIHSNINTGQDYSPWFSDSVDTLVQDAWQNNFLYVDVSLKLQHHTKITKLSLYDWQGVFNDKPAYIYAANGTTRTLLTIFTGPHYMYFEDTVFNQPVDADSIIVHKYSNNIPQKIFIYGYPTADSIVTPPPPPPPVTDTTTKTDTIVKIPLDPKRWYQLDNVSNGLEGLFDGITNVPIYTGWGKIFENYDAWYPVAPGEKIDLYKIKLFSYQGSQRDNPLTISVLDSTGNRKTIGTFVGGQYNTWVGPYPDRSTSGEAKFMLDSVCKNIKYLVLNCSNQFPTEIEFYGTYTAAPAPTPAVKKSAKLKQFFGVNAFEWDFEDGRNPMVIDTNRLKAVKAFTQVRHYMDWQKLESQQGSYTFNPVNNGGWNYDAIYARCKQEGIEVLPDLKTLPAWMVATYPDSLKDSENVPVRYGSDLSNPNSYIEQAKVAFQFVARYGSNTTVNPGLLSVNSMPRWTNDDVNSIKIGMGLIKYIECDNERDKWWKGRKAYQTSYEYAANLSAFYDGNKNTMGPGVGVKNADPNIKVVMGGLAAANTDYVRGMIDWCKQHRGYKADGSVNLCWDVINYHLYANDAQSSQSGNPTRGAAPELAGTAAVANDFIQMAHTNAGDMPVWVTELGYDINQGSPLKAIPIGNKTALQTQADWVLRSSLLYARTGVERIFFYELYDDNAQNPIQFGSSGLINADRTRKPAADYLYQTNKLLGEYTYKETLNTDPIVDHYDLNGQPAYVLVIPDEKGRTAAYALSLPGTDSARVYAPTAGRDTMQWQTVKTVNGVLNLNVTETPLFVIPNSTLPPFQANNFFAKAPSPADAAAANLTTANVATGSKQTAGTIQVYPNPTANYVTVSYQSNYTDPVNVYLADAATGRVYQKVELTGTEGNYQSKLDLSTYPAGVYMVKIIQGKNTVVKKVIKAN